MTEKEMKAKEIEEFGARITVFENGDVFISTHGDVHILECRYFFDEAEMVRSHD